MDDGSLLTPDETEQARAADPAELVDDGDEKGAGGGGAAAAAAAAVECSVCLDQVAELRMQPFPHPECQHRFCTECMASSEPAPPAKLV